MIHGKGFYTWQLDRCMNGNPIAIADKVEEAGASHIVMKVCDGPYYFGNQILNMQVADEMRKRGIGVLLWGYVYLSDPVGEARIAAEMMTKYNGDEFVIDAEVEAKGRADRAKLYMDTLRPLTNKPLSLSSYRWPTVHRDFPWAAFLEKCDYNMPQCYYEGAHNVAAQVARMLKEFGDVKEVGYLRPVTPTGPAYQAGTWKPTPNDMTVFLETCKASGCSGANVWSLQHILALPELFAAFKAVSWPGELPPPVVVPNPALALAAAQLAEANELLAKATALVGSAGVVVRNESGE